MMSAQPDETEVLQPNYCRECGRELSDIDGVEEYHEECVGIRITPVVKRLRVLKKTCTCGCCNHVEYTRRINPVYLSSEIRALVVYLNIVMCMPYNRIKSFLHDVMRVDISEGSIRNSLRKLKNHVFLFLTDPRVPSHNNASEGGIRILKVKQKRSGGFRSQAGAEDFMAIHSVADTAKKNDISRWGYSCVGLNDRPN